MKAFKSENLVFRKHKKKNRNKFIDLFTDREVMRFVDKGKLTKEKAESFWKKEIAGERELNKMWAICLKEDDEYIGNCVLNIMNEEDQKWEIGYYLLKRFWGKGYATEIAERLARFCFEELNFKEIYATVDDDHFASIRVLIKAGFEFCGYEFDEEGRYSVYKKQK